MTATGVATREYAVTVRGLRKAYRRRPVLRDVGFRLPRGTVVGVHGENGAGKSTLVRCVAGHDVPDGGEITVAGRLGYCPQDGALPDALTPREVLRLFGSAYGLAPEVTAARTATLAARYSCTAHLDQRVGRLSGGTRQKVDLLAALLPEPAVLVLDEPYQGFDHATYEAFWRHAAELRDAGVAILVVSHVHAERRRFDALIELAGGTVTVAGPAADLVGVT